MCCCAYCDERRIPIILNNIDFQTSIIEDASSEHMRLEEELKDINEEIKEAQEEEEEEKRNILKSDDLIILNKEYRMLNRIIDSHRKEKRTAQIPNIFAQRREILERMSKIEARIV